SQGIRIDVARLSANLGVPVVPIQANKAKGLAELTKVVADSVGASCPGAGPAFPAAFEREVLELHEIVGKDVPPFIVRRLLLDVGGHTERIFSERFNHQLTAKLS